MKNLKEINPTLDNLVDIELKGDLNEISFFIRNNFEPFQNEFPFLHDTISVSLAIERILVNLKSEVLFMATLEKIKGLAEKYFYRNISLLLSEFYLGNNNLPGIYNIIENHLIDEFKFHGYRHLLSYYAKNYNEDKFLEIFKKIEKRNTLNPYDRNAISLFIEKYTDTVQDIEQTKKMVFKNKIWNKIEDYITPMLVGLFKNRSYKTYNLIEEIVNTEIENLDNTYFVIENVLNELYEKSNNKEIKNTILDLLQGLCEKIPKELKVKGYPSKVWTLILWRVGCKYIELNNPERVKEIMMKLTGKNKESLKKFYCEKYK